MICFPCNDFSIIHVNRDKDHRQGGRSGEDSGRMMQRDRSFNGPVSSSSDRSNFDQKPTNGSQVVSRQSSGMSATMYSKYACASLISVVY
jgi:hypothetical protein